MSDTFKTALPGYHTTEEIAKRLNKKDGSYYRRLCSTGKLKGYFAAKTWFVPDEVVEILVEKEKMKT